MIASRPIRIFGRAISVVEIDGHPYVLLPELCRSLGIDPAKEHESISMSPLGTFLRGDGPFGTYIDLLAVYLWIAYSSPPSAISRRVRREFRSLQARVSRVVSGAFWQPWTHGEECFPCVPESLKAAECEAVQHSLGSVISDSSESEIECSGGEV